MFGLDFSTTDNAYSRGLQRVVSWLLPPLPLVPGPPCASCTRASSCSFPDARPPPPPLRLPTRVRPQPRAAAEATPISLDSVAIRTPFGGRRLTRLHFSKTFTTYRCTRVKVRVVCVCVHVRLPSIHIYLYVYICIFWGGGHAFATDLYGVTLTTTSLPCLPS